MKNSKQMSESIGLGVVLAFAGGFMDAYSYLCRDHVFANAQTGNMLLLGVNLSSGNFPEALRYFCPVLAFTLGIMLADLARIHLKENGRLHWRQLAVLGEALVLIMVGFLPQSKNLLANSLISFACGIQVESFRKIRGNGIATTMCIGNLRSATQNICDYLHTKDKQARNRGLLYFGIICFFVLGAIAGNQVVNRLAQKAVLVCAGVLFAAFCMMFREAE